MGLLAPLYALAALAIAGPILLHLIRRQPQGEQQFSSLMFLRPSPPTLTRRSRLENWFLLLLRIAAIALIALAFARPYLREESLLNLSLDGRHIVLIADTSASMRRPGVWESTVEEMEEVLGALGPQDRVALFTVDQQVKTIVGLDSNAQLDSQSQRQAVQNAVASLKPTWFRSEIGNGLTAIADQLTAVDTEAAAVAIEIVLFTDLHQDCGVESLQGYPWPKNVKLDIRQVEAAEPGNAFASLMEDREETADESDPVLRVRLENSAESSAQNLELQWVNSQGTPQRSTRVQVPAGQVRVIPVPAQPSDSSCLRLIGDAWQDDNDLFLFKPRPKRELVAYIAAEELEQEQEENQHPQYFLELAPLDTDLVFREVARHQATDIPMLIRDPACKVLVLEPSQSTLNYSADVVDFAKSGGVVLICLSDDRLEPSLTEQFLTGMLISQKPTSTQDASPSLRVEPSNGDGDEYSLISWVDYRHPIFKPFADPRFNDFSKIRIWHHFSVTLPANASDVRVVSKFDDESPMLMHRVLGKGDIWVLTTGWQPKASSLALSTKFVPILNGLLDPRGFARQAQLRYEVGEQFACDEQTAFFDAVGTPVPETKMEVGPDGVSFRQPGLYFIDSAERSAVNSTDTEEETAEDGDEPEAGTSPSGALDESLDDPERWLAVEVPASERDVTPLDVDVFEQYGITLDKVNTQTQRKEAARQLQVEELENRQKLWQWLLGAGVAILVLETLVAGRAARKKIAQAVAT